MYVYTRGRQSEDEETVRPSLRVSFPLVCTRACSRTEQSRVEYSETEHSITVRSIFAQLFLSAIWERQQIPQQHSSSTFELQQNQQQHWHF